MTQTASSPKRIVLITGSTSGIGKATADYFTTRGWKVLGTTRGQANNDNLYQLDVTNATATKQGIARMVSDHGQIDVVVNNAGYGLYGAFEQCDEKDVRAQYEVNVFGTMNVCRAILPHMRARHAGTIINIASMGGKIAVPYYTVYNSTKFAVEGFSEGLWHEVLPFGIKVKVIEPGAINTGFYDRSKLEGKLMSITPEYKAMADKLWPGYERAGRTGAVPEVVAQVVYKAAISHSRRLRYAAAFDAHLNIATLKLLPHQIGLWLVRQVTMNR